MTATGVAADNSPIPMDGIPNLSYDNTSNRITTAGFEYDVAGNQTRALAEDGVTWVRYEYDAANRLSVVKRDDANQTLLQAFQYGSTNARLIDYDPAAGVNKFYASVGGTVMAEYTEYAQYVFTWIKSYTYLGDSLLSTVTPNGAGGEATEYNHPDRLGTRLVTNQQLGTSYEQAHLPFGRPLNAESSLTTNNKRFTSYDRSAATGLDYAINRTYDSKLGRFMQVDPIGMQAISLASPQTLNMYAYCGNDPINHVDPSGLFFGKLFKWIGKIFRAVNKILKWVAVAVGIILIVSAIIYMAGGAMPALLGDFIGWFIGLGGKALGIASSFVGSLAGALGIEIGAGIGGYIAAGLYGIGAVASEYQSKRPLSRRSIFPCPPTFAVMALRFLRLFANLLEKNSGHQTDSPLENGGWIYQRKNGALFFLRADNAVRMGGSPAMRYRNAIDLSRPPSIKETRVVGKVHTHPYTPYEQELISSGQSYGGPSSIDMLNSAKEQMPSIVVYQAGTINGRRKIAIEIANPNVRVIPDQNCSRRELR